MIEDEQSSASWGAYGTLVIIRSTVKRIFLFSEETSQQVWLRDEGTAQG